MWNPTHVQVTVLRARNLPKKGKGGANDVYVTIQLGKEKFQTSVKERAVVPEWQEECDLQITDGSAAVKLAVYNRSFLGLDDFLGQVLLPLEQFPIYERPRSRWFALKPKANKKDGDSKDRGEIEVKLTFIVQNMSGSTNSLNKQPKIKSQRSGSIINLASSVGEKLKMPNRSNSLKGEKKKNPLISSDHNDPDATINSDEPTPSPPSPSNAHSNARETQHREHSTSSEATEDDSAGGAALLETVKKTKRMLAVKVEDDASRYSSNEEIMIDSQPCDVTNNNNNKHTSNSAHSSAKNSANNSASSNNYNPFDINDEEEKEEAGYNPFDEPEEEHCDGDAKCDDDDDRHSDAGDDLDITPTGDVMYESEEEGAQHKEGESDEASPRERAIDVEPSPLRRQYSSRKRIRPRTKPQAPAPPITVTDTSSPIPTPSNTSDPTASNSSPMYELFGGSNGNVSKSPKLEKRSGRRISFPTLGFAAQHKYVSKLKAAAEFPSYNPSNLVTQSEFSSCSEADLYSKWKAAVDSKEDTEEFTKNRQPIYRAGGKISTMMKTCSEADVTNTKIMSISDEVPLLDEDSKSTVDVSSVGGTMDNTDSAPYWIRSHPGVSSSLRSSMTGSMTGSIPEEADESLHSPSSGDAPIHTADTNGTTVNQANTKNTQQLRTGSKQSKNDPSRRHTLQLGVTNLPKLELHKLRDTTTSAQTNITHTNMNGATTTNTTAAAQGQQQQQHSSGAQHKLPQKFLDQYKDFGREDLLLLLYSQKQQLDKNDSYVRDLEAYIDNLLVRVMESTPRLLQNPYKRGFKNQRNHQHTSDTQPQRGNTTAHHPPQQQETLTMKPENLPPQGNLAHPVFIETRTATTTSSSTTPASLTAQKRVHRGCT